MKINVHYIFYYFQTVIFLKARWQFVSGSDEDRDRTGGSLFQRIIIISTTRLVTHLSQCGIGTNRRQTN